MDTIPYDILKYIHILAAIVAVGANITYGVWSVRARRDPAHLAFAINGIRFIDNRIANPAYGVLFLTGVLMVIVGGIGLKLWVVAAVILFVAIAVIGFAYFTPLVRRQLALLDAGDASSPEFERLARRNAMIGPILGVIVLVILGLMVFQPSL
ncbi:MAG TPA: DUF2269 family protein [Candidatus Dormibacteraeota bacterium]|nr:DUF2269 family protein [Candidatus Dormibacteraeota bacterium]